MCLVHFDVFDLALAEWPSKLLVALTHVDVLASRNLMKITRE
jgi:hypothetical protein